MRITRWGEYGILCSLYLAQRNSPTPVGAADIAEARGIPMQYAQQILHRLRKGGVIATVRGPKGGYRLARPPEQITLRQILTAAEGDTFELICVTDPIHPEQCAQEPCGLKRVWEDLKVAIDQALDARTLAAIAVLESEAKVVQIGGVLHGTAR